MSFTRATPFQATCLQHLEDLLAARGLRFSSVQLEQGEGFVYLLCCFEAHGEPIRIHVYDDEAGISYGTHSWSLERVDYDSENALREDLLRRTETVIETGLPLLEGEDLDPWVRRWRALRSLFKRR